MKEVFGNIWNYPADIICITTNGDIDRFGNNVMDRGISLEAKKRYPGIEKTIGSFLAMHGNHVFVVAIVDGKYLCTFPTKYHWKNKSDIILIKHSVSELKIIVEQGIDMDNQKLNFVLPRPGCGNGQLDWKDVKPLLLELPDNVHVIANETE